MELASITPEDLHKLRLEQGSVDLIDVRTPVEYRQVHATGARNLPLDGLDVAGVQAVRTATNRPVYVICRSGKRSAQACETLRAGGMDNVVNVTGGTLAWEQAALPVERDTQVISLERQVRIVVGTMVLTGLALGQMVAPAGYGLAAFAGAGLVFAGVTDFCGMAMLLAKLPFNQGATSCKRG